MRLYGHRGAPAHAPENTLESFRRALRDGADAIETDVHLTSDGVLVVSHDPDGLRRAGVNALLSETPLSEIRRWDVGGQTRIPTLEEALEAFPDTLFNVDLKPRSLDAAREALKVVERTRAKERLQLGSFHDEVIRFVRHERPSLVTALGPREVWRLALSPRALLRRPNGPRRAQVPLRGGPLRLDTQAFVDKAHALGIAVDYWVVNDPATAARLAALGADGLVSDDPARVRDACHSVST